MLHSMCFGLDKLSFAPASFFYLYQFQQMILYHVNTLNWIMLKTERVTMSVLRLLLVVCLSVHIADAHLEPVAPDIIQHFQVRKFLRRSLVIDRSCSKTPSKRSYSEVLLKR